MALTKLTTLGILLISSAFYYAFSQNTVIELNEDNWYQILHGEWMIEFYAPWCPACKGLQSIWKEFALLGSELKIKVGQVDVTTSPGLSGRFIVTALPTIFHVLDGNFRQYKNSRDKLSFISFVKEQKWKSVDPIPSWKSPGSIQMSIVSSFFKLSQMLRGIHSHLMEEFGLPTWGSYLIFAIATIILGALLGLILVCIIDFVYPPKQIVPKKVQQKGKSDKQSDDELTDEDIKDDLFDDVEKSNGSQESGSESTEEKTKPSSPNVKKRKPRKAD
ncbi:hypothetical protein RN001_014460 [Aquatica leii]|uniref:Thioredoxin domain-containing protein n=1 Tax=Aquatica leii TaxID=1421715 RepID=A0AAN7S677_9COLE|nr:hypothetical protein RN001_014460 [Aquatica leii]